MDKNKSVEAVKKYYDDEVLKEWGRLERHRVEFEITKRFLKRYIKSGSKVLDLGGGPGRYSLFLSEIGCDVTLADLSQKNVDFALQKAKEMNLNLRGFQADARNPTAVKGELFDHILLMGPMYHLINESDRVCAVNECMKMLNQGGTLYVSFISSYGGIIYSMKYEPEAILNPLLNESYELFALDKEYAGESFTQSIFYRQGDVLPFMNRFPLEKLHFLGAESILAPNEPNILSQSDEIIEKWIDLAERVCERTDLLSFSEHFLYIGRKK